MTTTPTPDNLAIPDAAVAQAAAEIADAVMGNDDLMHILDEQQRQEVNADIRIEARRVISSLPPIPDRGYAEAGELPDAVRVPLHSLTADIEYLFGRVAADGSCAPAMANSALDRLRQIDAALLAITPVAAEAGDVSEFEHGDWDAPAHVRFLRNQAGASAGYTADLIERLFAALLAARRVQPKLDVPSPDVAGLIEALKDTLAHLVAATSLLERGGKKAAPSDKMFTQMIRDYEASIKRARALVSRMADGEKEPRRWICPTCQGNGEIVTNWDRYLHGPLDKDGNDAVAECPDCDGTGYCEAAVLS